MANQEPHPTTIALALPSGNSPPLPPRPLNPLFQSRSWSEYAMMAAVVGGVGYAIIHFLKVRFVSWNVFLFHFLVVYVQNYVIPWFNAPRAQELKQLEDIHASVNQLQSTVSETVSSVAESTKSIQVCLEIIFLGTVVLFPPSICNM